MITNEFINAVLDGQVEGFDEADKAAIGWQYHKATFGGFRRALWGAIEVADDTNLQRLAAGFPIDVKGYYRWTLGGLGTRLWAAAEEYAKRGNK